MLELTKENIWVIAGDTHIGKWVRDSKQMIKCGEACEAGLARLKCGDVVLDVGCNIGCHSYHFAHAVAPDGQVIGIDANPECVEAAKRNCENLPCRFYNFAAGNHRDVGMLKLDPNVGASHMVLLDDAEKVYVTPDANGVMVSIDTLDSRFHSLERLDLIKLDVEGSEVDAIEGGRQLIERFHPHIICEVNEGALQRRKTSRKELFALLRSLKYEWSVIPHGMNIYSPQYDIVCFYAPHP